MAGASACAACSPGTYSNSTGSLRSVAAICDDAGQAHKERSHVFNQSLPSLYLMCFGVCARQVLYFVVSHRLHPESAIFVCVKVRSIVVVESDNHGTTCSVTEPKCAFGRRNVILSLHTMSCWIVHQYFRLMSSITYIVYASW